MIELSLKEMPPKAHIYSSIFSLSNSLQMLGDKYDLNISTKQWFVLAAVASFEDYALNLGDAANILGTSRQNLKKIVVLLEKKGYVNLKKDECDARSTKIALTSKCKAYYRNRGKQEEIYLNKLFEGFDDETLMIFHEGLNMLMKNSLAIEKNETVAKKQ